MELAAGQVQATNPSNSLLFGFSIRGGSEYRTGFFVSHVEPGSEADLQGVQVRVRVGGRRLGISHELFAFV